MGFFNRCLLFVYTLFFGLVSAGVAALCLHLVPDRVLLNEYEYCMSQWQTGAVAGVLLLVSLHLLLCCFDRSKSREVHAKELLVLQGKTGQVNVSLSAIRNMAEAMAANVRGVRQAKVSTVVEHRKDQGDFLKLSLKLEIGQERNIQELSDDVRHALSAYLVQTAGIHDVDIDISVQTIAGGVSVKKRRIR